MAEKDIGKTIQKTLVAGIALSTSLILLGLAVRLAPAWAAEGRLLVGAGLAVLLFTPMARVIMLARAFRREGLTRYAFAAAAVLLIMLAGLFTK